MQPTTDKEKRYTYADYARWHDGNRYELIDGAMYVMEPGASEYHQDVNVELLRQFANFFLDKPGKVFHPPFDVCLNAGGDNDSTVVQPDIVIVCDLSKLDGKRCNGAPDMVIEIVSPSSVRMDVLIKMNNYMKAGIREYWIVDPEDHLVRVCLLKDGKYDFTDYVDEDMIRVSVLNGCEIDMKRVFKEVKSHNGT